MMEVWSSLDQITKQLKREQHSDYRGIEVSSGHPSAGLGKFNSAGIDASVRSGETSAGEKIPSKTETKRGRK
jgi:hypothetical protein